MIHVITGVRPGENALLEQAFRLRHRVFVGEKQWTDLTRPDGREVDEFDGPASVYILAVEDGIVRGHVRLNPTTRPHLLADKHSHLCYRPQPRGPHVWEWTRYCVDPAVRGGRRWGEIASRVEIAAIEWGLMNGIKDIVVEYEPKFMTRHHQMGFKVTPLGIAEEMNGEFVVAVHLQCREDTLDKSRAALNVPGPVLSPSIVPAISRVA
ncbi:MAG: acyl-homoserine-lactone synthase [Phreatobacter sp.]